MTPDERSLLERTNKLAEENNDILRSMRRMNRISGTFRVLYWVVIIGASIGAYYFIQPYIDQASKLYNGAQSVIQEQSDTVKAISNTVNGVKNILPK